MPYTLPWSSRLARRYRYSLTLLVDTASRRVNVSLQRDRHQSFAREFIPLAAIFIAVTCVSAPSTPTLVPAWLLGCCAVTVLACGLSLLFRPSKRAIMPLLQPLPESGDLTCRALVCGSDTAGAQDLLHTAWEVCDVRYPGTGEQRDAIMTAILTRLEALGTLELARRSGAATVVAENVSRVRTYTSATEDLPFTYCPPTSLQEKAATATAVA